MPIYEYRCDTCGCKYEKLRTIGNADSPTDCPQCGGAESRRLISVFAAVSKGEGGTTSQIGGGSSCGSCSSSNCGSCGH